MLLIEVTEGLCRGIGTSIIEVIEDPSIFSSISGVYAFLVILA